MGDGTVLRVGRQHQPQAFEALLMGSPVSLTFISRTHLQLEVCSSGTSLNVTNLSGCPVYIGKEPLAKSDSPRSLAPDQELSFARLENGKHVFFLSLRACAPEDVEAVASQQAS